MKNWPTDSYPSLTEFEEIKIKEDLRSKCLNIFYRKEDDGYLIYCPQCDTKTKMSKSEFYIYKQVKLCNKCFKKIYKTTTSDIIVYDFYEKTDNEYQYVYYCGISIGADGIKYFYQDCVGIKKDNKMICRRLVNSMGYYNGAHYSYNVNSNWHLTNSYNFKNCSNAIDNIKKDFIYLSKKDYLTSFMYEYGGRTDELFKSNQIYLFKKNHVTHKMMAGTLVFDLKNYKDLLKYKDYFNAITSYNLQEMMDFHMNINTLNYLKNNNINLIDYCDYLEQCKKLGIKDKYPKNFAAKHSDLSESLKKITRDYRDLRCDELIKKRKLKKYSHDKYEINEFESVSKIKEIATYMRNCMYSNYVEKYAEGRCDLYYMTEDGVPIGCIEVVNGTIIQERGKCNRELDSEYKKVIKKWIKMNYGSNTSLQQTN